MAKILVVDDAEEMVRLLKRQLTLQGYQVVAAGSGCAALDLVAAERPDAVLLDVQMPEMDGIEVCRRLKADPATCTIPLIMLTAKGSDEDLVAGLNAGADDYVCKPFRSEVLAARIRSALRAKMQHETIARMERELAQVQRLESIGRLAAGIAHELNTPAQYISANLRFLDETLLALGGALRTSQAISCATRDNTLTAGLLAESENAIREVDFDYYLREIPAAIRESLEGVEHMARIIRTLKECAQPGADRDRTAELRKLISAPGAGPDAG
jgi:DNA-binding response OmpR family regulator